MGVPVSKALERDLSNEHQEDENKGVKNQELTNDRIRAIRKRLEKAEEEQVICAKDFSRLIARLEGLPPHEKPKAEQHLEEHLEKKKEHKERFEQKLKDALVNGLLAPGEYKKQLEKYHDSSGEERKTMEDDLDITTKEREHETKTIEELLENPHFQEENGTRTEAAEGWIKKYQTAESDTKREEIKQQLVEDLAELEWAEGKCEQYYKAANKLYSEGKFVSGEIILQSVVKLCEKYPESLRMQAIKDWNERDLKNMEDHTRQQKEIEAMQRVRKEFEDAGNLLKALLVAEDLVRKTEEFLLFTTNRDGQLVMRKEQYKTPYLENLHEQAHQELNILQSVSHEQKKRQQERSSGAVEKAFMKEYTESREGHDHAVKAGILEEELRKRDEDRRTDEDDVIQLRTVHNEDIENKSEEELSANQEGLTEVAVDFQKEQDHERLRMIREAEDVNTGVTTDGRAITEDHELEELAGDETEDIIHGFVNQEKRRGRLSEDTVEGVHEAMHDTVDSGEYGRNFTRETRKEGLDVVRFGDDFRRSQRELGEFILEQMDDGQEEEDESPAKIAEQIREARRAYQQRQAVGSSRAEAA